MVEISRGTFRTTSHQDALRWLREEEEPLLRKCLASHGSWATRLAVRYITNAHYQTSRRAVEFMEFMAERFATGNYSPRNLRVALRRVKLKNGSW